MSELVKSVDNRVIQVFFNGKAINIATNANKWSDVVPLIENHDDGFDIKGKKAVLGSTKGVLQLPDALIPPGNQSIFLVQDKMRSGAEKPLEDISYIDLRRLAKEKGISGLGSSPKRQDLIDALKDVTKIKELKGSSKVVKEKKASIVKDVKNTAEQIRPELDERIEALENILGTLVEGIGEVLDSVRGKRSTSIKPVIESAKKVISNDPSNSFGQGDNKIKTEAELQAEFNSLKLK